MSSMELWLFVFAALGAIGGLAGVLVWLEIRPRHIRAWFVRTEVSEAGVSESPFRPKRGVIVVALAMLSVSLISSLYGLYRINEFDRNHSPEGWLAMVRNGKLQMVRNQTFTNEIVELDGKDIRDCAFVNPTFIYRGQKPYLLDHIQASGKIIVKMTFGPQQVGWVLAKQLQSACNLPTNSCEYDAVTDDLKPMPAY